MRRKIDRIIGILVWALLVVQFATPFVWYMKGSRVVNILLFAGVAFLWQLGNLILPLFAGIEHKGRNTAGIGFRVCSIGWLIFPELFVVLLLFAASLASGTLRFLNGYFLYSFSLSVVGLVSISVLVRQNQEAMARSQ